MNRGSELLQTMSLVIFGPLCCLLFAVPASAESSIGDPTNGESLSRSNVKFVANLKVRDLMNRLLIISMLVFILALFESPSFGNSNTDADFLSAQALELSQSGIEAIDSLEKDPEAGSLKDVTFVVHSPTLLRVLKLMREGSDAVKDQAVDLLIRSLKEFPDRRPKITHTSGADWADQIIYGTGLVSYFVEDTFFVSLGETYRASVGPVRSKLETFIQTQEFVRFLGSNQPRRFTNYGMDGEFFRATGRMALLMGEPLKLSLIEGLKSTEAFTAASLLLRHFDLRDLDELRGLCERIVFDRATRFLHGADDIIKTVDASGSTSDYFLEELLDLSFTPSNYGPAKSGKGAMRHFASRLGWQKFTSLLSKIISSPVSVNISDRYSEGMYRAAARKSGALLALIELEFATADLILEAISKFEIDVVIGFGANFGYDGTDMYREAIVDRLAKLGVSLETFTARIESAFPESTDRFRTRWPRINRTDVVRRLKELGIY